MAGETPQNLSRMEPRPRVMKHVSRACYGCRKRKTKCDGAKPQCANCALYKQDCIFSQEIDRRKVASKEKLSTMLAYVKDLESLLSRHKIDLPDSRPNHLLSSVSPSTSPAGLSQETFGALGQNTTGFPGPSVGEQMATTPTENSPDAQDLLSISGESSYGMSLISDRMGSLQIAEDGQLRFFGPTSNLHISHVGPFPLFNSNIRSVYRNEALILKAAGVDHHVDEELEDHLTRLYFTWENPNIPIVDEATYYREKTRYRKLNQFSHRYSEVLTNAM